MVRQGEDDSCQEGIEKSEVVVKGSDGALWREKCEERGQGRHSSSKGRWDGRGYYGEEDMVDIATVIIVELLNCCSVDGPGSDGI